ncbi:MAG: DUF368 domain-containing protein [Oscillospiraceae bacterium]|nr:DUF368 domain-containing protein [Oscillospiraceae bacterium]
MAKRFFYRIICGFFLGLSVFAPGFSGSLVAIIMGVYQDILRIVSNPFKQFKKNVKFALPIGIGVALSAVLFLVSFKFLFENYEKATYLLFVGLIAGNLPVILSEIKKRGFKKHYLIGGLAAFAAALFLGLFSLNLNQIAVTGDVGWPLLALGGFLAGAVAFMPGMSVSMVLIMLGVYGYIISAAEAPLHLNFSHLPQLGAFLGCALVGLVLASKGIKALFEKFFGLANSMVLGFMLGSLGGIFVQSIQIDDPGFGWIFGGLMLGAGLGISALFFVLGKSMNKPEQTEQTEKTTKNGENFIE